MSLPIFQSNNKVLDAVVLSTGRTSSVVDVSEVINFAVHNIFTGTPTGTITIQASNNNIDFATLTTVALAGAAGSDIKNFNDIGYLFVRVIYTFASSTGTLTTYISCKRN